jgi:hypothetical protein
MRQQSALAKGLLFVALMVGSAKAYGAQVTVTRFSGRGVQADFQFADDTNCFVTAASVLFAENVFRASDTPADRSSAVMVDLVYENNCTGDFFVLSGSAAQATFSVTGNLGMATLAAQVPVSDGNGVNTTVNVSLVFAATGPLQKVHNRSKSNNGGTITIMDSRSEARMASATGSVSAVLPLSTGPATVEFASLGSGDASLAKDFQGTITIMR